MGQMQRTNVTGLCIRQSVGMLLTVMSFSCQERWLWSAVAILIIFLISRINTGWVIINEKLILYLIKWIPRDPTANSGLMPNKAANKWSHPDVIVIVIGGHLQPLLLLCLLWMCCVRLRRLIGYWAFRLTHCDSGRLQGWRSGQTCVDTGLLIWSHPFSLHTPASTLRPWMSVGVTFVCVSHSGKTQCAQWPWWTCLVHRCGHFIQTTGSPRQPVFPLCVFTLICIVG